jgi:hypothetical protein
VPRWRFADLGRHGALLARARTDAAAILLEDPELERPEHARLRQAALGLASAEGESG